MFDSLSVANWRQFSKVEIKFHPRVTILTGANGAGKTTILNLINDQFGWSVPMTATPVNDRLTGVRSFLSGIFKPFWKPVPEVPAGNEMIGFIRYQNKRLCYLSVPKTSAATYQILSQNREHVYGFVVPSHRPVYSYQAIPSISTSIASKGTAFSDYNSTKSSRIFGSHMGYRENYHIKNTLVSLAVFGYGNQAVVENKEAINIFEGFQGILAKVLPRTLGFKKIEVRVPEVVLVTETGEFPIDGVSGGVASIIDLAWQLYMYEVPDNKFVVTIDEPENHLHPQMQKSLLPDFLEAFPGVQFIIATHSPFIISSVPASNVYVLNYNENKKVVSLILDHIDKSGSANEILRDVLGLETTKPNWVEDKIEQIISKYLEKGITKENVNAFRSELKEIGLDKYVPESVGELIEKSKDQ